MAIRLTIPVVIVWPQQVNNYGTYLLPFVVVIQGYLRDSHGLLTVNFWIRPKRRTTMHFHVPRIIGPATNR
jgi:hypothetical protein